MQAVDGTRELDFGDSRKKVAVSDLHFHSSKMSAQTEMLPNSEPDMAIRLAIDLEGPRIFEDFFVAIRRGVVERDGLTFEDSLISKLIVQCRTCLWLPRVGAGMQQRWWGWFFGQWQ